MTWSSSALWAALSAPGGRREASKVTLVARFSKEGNRKCTSVPSILYESEVKCGAYFSVRTRRQVA